jgi:hypothetical protein
VHLLRKLLPVFLDLAAVPCESRPTDAFATVLGQFKRDPFKGDPGECWVVIAYEFGEKFLLPV